jgi:hypothetical protein
VVLCNGSCQFQIGVRDTSIGVAGANQASLDLWWERCSPQDRVASYVTPRTFAIMLLHTTQCLPGMRSRECSRAFRTIGKIDDGSFL